MGWRCPAGMALEAAAIEAVGACLEATAAGLAAVARAAARVAATEAVGWVADWAVALVAARAPARCR